MTNGKNISIKDKKNPPFDKGGFLGGTWRIVILFTTSHITPQHPSKDQHFIFK